MNIEIEWTDDCSGKKDYDGDVVRVSTRYWPRGGGFLSFGPEGFKDNDARPEIKPSAKSHILLGDEDLATAEFEGETEAEVKAQVEAWVAEQLARIESAMRAAFTTHPQAAPAQGDGEMAKIGRLIETQDNRITEAPIFIVQQKRWICGVDPDYGGERVWVNHARESVEITDEAEIARLDAEYAEEYTAPKGYTLTGKMHVWDFVTACFTEQGCKDYLARDGHNLKEPRIYAAGSYRNEEWRSVRKFLMSLAAAPSPEGES